MLPIAPLVMQILIVIQFFLHIFKEYSALYFDKYETSVNDLKYKTSPINKNDIYTPASRVGKAVEE